MKLKTRRVVAGACLGLCVTAFHPAFQTAFADPAEPPSEPAATVDRKALQTVQPVGTYNAELAAERIAPSATRPIEPGQRLDVPYVTPADEWVVQKLTDRSYWILSDQFAVTLFVGDKGALVIDAPDVFEMDDFIEQVRKLTPLPISTVVYSHPHMDHVGKAGELAQRMRTHGVELRIIGSEDAVREIKRYGNALSLPTEVIPHGRGSFSFEKWTFKFVTPVVWAHTGADSYVVTPDGILHLVDFFYPGRLPMAEVSHVENMTGWIDMLRHVAGEKGWTVANLGHANLGYPQDVTLTLRYFEDLYRAAHSVFNGFTPEVFGMFKGQNTGVMIRNLMDDGALRIAERVADTWSDYPQWEVARDHAEKVLWEVALYYNHRTDALPDFEPIPPQ